jgi:hypothetical protein
MSLSDEFSRILTQYAPLDITVCGSELVTDTAPGVPISKVYAIPSGTPAKIVRETDINPVFTVDTSGALTHAFCTAMVFETYEDSGCTTQLSDTKLTQVSDRNVFWAGPYSDTAGGGNYINVDISSGFLKKTKYVLFLTKGLQSLCKPIEIEVCGAETVSNVVG